ncbi:long-chain fatty acid--CoA ligase [Tistrella bauzanensis]|uniref:Long-chain fatty acid--CoA ligase n=1 Tax=Tistrella arctica TaxID=3133430 RepID=A0ABU9YFS6_9PROT
MTQQFPDFSVHDTLPKLLAHNAATWPGEVALREKEFGIWNEYTWSDYNDRVRELTLGLIELGVTRGEVVAILSKNRPEALYGEIAIQAAGAMSLAMYQDAMGNEVAYLLTYAGAQVVLCEDEEQVDKLLELEDQIPTVRTIVYADARGMRKYDDPRLRDLAEVYALGRALHGREPDRYARELAAGRGSDVAILCTTSGTTSNPKMAMLAGRSFLEHCARYLMVDPKGPADDYVSVLPMPWIMEQIYAVAQPLICRIRVNFVEEPETMMADLREIGPSFVLLAPRVWEQIAADVRARMMESTRLKNALYDFGMKRALKAVDQGRTSKLASFIVLRALRDRLGFSNLKSAATGGAALGPDTFRFFQALGVPLRQIYGQTETAGAFTVHLAGDVDMNTVGKPFPGVEVKIVDPDENGVGEIVARHGGLMAGYYNNEKATREDLRDGWMHSGDAGFFNPQGHLVVIDRIKDIAETSGRVRFSPQFIENKLKFSSFIGECVVLGHQKPFVTAIICIRYSVVSKWAEQRGIAFTTYTDLSARQDVYDLLSAEVERVNATLPEAHRIKRFLLLYKELDADDGELTRTRKVRRNVINDRYGRIIDAIYAGQDKIDIDTTITFQDGKQARIQTVLRIVDMGDPMEPLRKAS